MVIVEVFLSTVAKEFEAGECTRPWVLFLVMLLVKISNLLSSTKTIEPNRFSDGLLNTGK